MVPAESIFHWSEQWKSEGAKSTLTVDPAKFCNVLYGLETAMVPGVIVLQEKGCLLWSDSGNSGLRPSQRRDIAVRVHGLLRFARMS
jgi:hypothetical protein